MIMKQLGKKSLITSNKERKRPKKRIFSTALRPLWWYILFITASHKFSLYLSIQISYMCSARRVTNKTPKIDKSDIGLNIDTRLFSKINRIIKC